MRVEHIRKTTILIAGAQIIAGHSKKILASQKREITTQGSDTLAVHVCIDGCLHRSRSTIDSDPLNTHSSLSLYLSRTLSLPLSLS